MSPRDLSETESVAAVLDRLAMLLRGGAAPATAWGLVAKHGRGDDVTRDVVREVARALDTGGDVGQVLARRAESGWRALGCAWSLAGRTGAPLARSLGDLAGGFRDVGEAERDVRVALEGPTSTSRIVIALPAVGLGLGLVMGVDTLGVLTRTPLGIACLAVGLVLIGGAWWWMRTLVRSARDGDPHPGLSLDLVALGMRGGGSAGDVASAVSSAMREYSLRDGAADDIARTLALAADAGVPPAELLRREASLARVIARASAKRRAAKLGAALMLPLGVCVLPAFIALGVAPLVLAILGDVVGPLP
ncbi:MAG: type II secretion system F family protein [Pseudoclavibacter sp.]